MEEENENKNEETEIETETGPETKCIRCHNEFTGKKCPKCGLKRGIEKCIDCQKWYHAIDMRNRVCPDCYEKEKEMAARQKSPLFAAILSIIPGAGLYYFGLEKLGKNFFIGCLIFVVASLLVQIFAFLLGAGGIDENVSIVLDFTTRLTSMLMFFFKFIWIGGIIATYIYARRINSVK